MLTTQLYCLLCRTWVLAQREETDYVCCWLCLGCGNAAGLRTAPPTQSPPHPTATAQLRARAARRRA